MCPSFSQLILSFLSTRYNYPHNCKGLYENFIHQVIDWNTAAVILPVQRVTELHFLLRTFGHGDIFSMKRQGRMLLETYFSSRSTVLDTVLDVIRHRLSIPGLAFSDTPSPSIFNKTFTPLLMDHLPPEVEPDESLGNIEFCKNIHHCQLIVIIRTFGTAISISQF